MDFDINNFFLLRGSFKRAELRVQPTVVKQDNSKNLIVSKPVEYDVHMGKRAYDLISTTDVGVDLFHESLINKLISENITGFETYPVQINHPDAEDYYGLNITGKCGELYVRKSTVTTVAPPFEFGSSVVAYVGYFFDRNEWDGSDFFRPRYMPYTIITQSVKKIIEALKATNISLTPLSEIERDVRSPLGLLKVRD